MKISAFKAVRPPIELAAKVASLPYDVGDLASARREAAANPLTFLHVERPEVDVPAGFDPAGGAHHASAAGSYQRFLREGYLEKDGAPSLFAYRLQQGEHTQEGLVAACHIGDYEANVIRRHEHTRKPTEDDRTRHVLAVGANTGPVFLAYRESSPAASALAAAGRDLIFDFAAPDGVRHTGWRLREPAAVIEAFREVPAAYVADGHHRAAAAFRAGAERRAASPAQRGDEEYNGFLAVLFPAAQLRILPYNRCLKDLAGQSAESFLGRLRAAVGVRACEGPAPAEGSRAGLYLGGRWYALSWDVPPGTDPVEALDVSVLQARVLGPLLGVADPRTDARIEYLGGFASVEEIVRRVDVGEAAVGFSLRPVAMGQLMDISDAGRVMPPKSTWFEPKLRSGLFVHELD
jgi:uncharacterized protein (DUF1015 family)